MQCDRQKQGSIQRVQGFIHQVSHFKFMAGLNGASEGTAPVHPKPRLPVSFSLFSEVGRKPALGQRSLSKPRGAPAGTDYESES